MSVGGVTFPLEQQSKDPQSVVYTGQYDTEGVAHTKSGERQPVQISIQVWIYTVLYFFSLALVSNISVRTITPDNCKAGNCYATVERLTMLLPSCKTSL